MKSKLIVSIRDLIDAIYSDTGQVYSGECEIEILKLAEAIENMIVEHKQGGH